VVSLRICCHPSAGPTRPGGNAEGGVVSRTRTLTGARTGNTRSGGGSEPAVYPPRHAVDRIGDSPARGHIASGQLPTTRAGEANHLPKQSMTQLRPRQSGSPPGPDSTRPWVSSMHKVRSRHSELPATTDSPEPGTSCTQLSRQEPRSPTTPRVEGAGRTMLACPTPSRKHPTNQLGS
jgi:hypothetical protein